MPKNKPSATIVQYADDAKTLPDGSKMIYAENDDTIVIYHKLPLEPDMTYVYNRASGNILVNNKPGSSQDKRKMIQLGNYFLSHASEDDLVTLDVFEEN